MQARSEGICGTSFVHEQRELRITHGELAAALDLHVLHGKAVHQHTRTGLGPLDDVDELLAQEIAE